jgi:hypothetical protein
MTANVQDYVLDNGLAALKSGATHIYIDSAEPSTYTAASSTYALGNNNFGAGAVFPGAIAAGSAPLGRQLATAAVTAGSVTATGTATNWSIVDAANSRLLAVGLLSASQAVTSGNTFALPSFTIKLVNS